MKELINLRRILKRPRSVARARRGAHPLRRLAPAAWLAAPLLAALLLPLAVVPQRGDNSRRRPRPCRRPRPFRRRRHRLPQRRRSRRSPSICRGADK